MATTARVLRTAALAAALAFAVLPAHADGFDARLPPDGPAGSLLSGVQACNATIEARASEGAGCMAGWAADHLLLDAAARFATIQGRARFGEHFRLVNKMSFSPSAGTFTGGLDVVLPLASSAASGAGPSEAGALFLQQGVTRWVDADDRERNDFRFGVVRRFDLSGDDTAPGVLGVSTFLQHSREYRHTTLVAGTDYAGKWGRGSLNLFLPATGWKAAHRAYEERALAGIELGMKLDLTTTLSMSTAVGHWEEEDGLGGWSTNGRMTVAWRPHRWLDIGVAWSAFGTFDDDRAVRVGFSMPLGASRRPPRWEGLGLAGGGPERSALDAWSPVDDIGAIQVARRAGRSERLDFGATVRFLQDSASTGDRIGMEVLLSAAASGDVHLVVTLAPGTGGTPAVPGVDFVDAPVPVTIRAGRSSAIVHVQLPLNSALDEDRSLRATVSLAS